MIENDYKTLLRKAKQNLPNLNMHSRFEIPEAIVVISGRRTFIKNFVEITKIIRREPKHLAKYIFKELAIPGNIKGGELILQGKTNSQLINRRINNYVNEFVLCNECKKPDTIIKKENNIYFIKCEACGAKRTLRRI
ncbi:MAG: translation initiation factor IF-2 subunit beta [Candidatus Aenigmatarchaeota archaeon]